MALLQWISLDTICLLTLGGNVKIGRFTFGVFLILACNFLFAAKEIFAKAAYREGSSPEYFIIIFVLVLIPFAAIIVIGHYIKRGRLHYRRKTILLSVLAGFLCYDLAMTLDFFGLTVVPVSIERSLFSVYPIFIYLGGLLIHPHSQIPRHVFWVVFSSIYAGVLLLFFDGYSSLTDDKAFHSYLFGSSEILLSAATCAAFFLISEKVIELTDPWFVAGIAMLSGSSLAATHIVIAQPDIIFSSHSPKLFALAAAAAFCTLLSGYWICIGIRAIGAVYSGLISAASPVFLVLIASPLLNEEVSLTQKSGIFLIGVGIGFLIWFRRNTDNAK
ncbi:DMT family transporter [Pseudovibrio sp. Tun.PSC04-5.I4]|uniref:DMT family transporter n=1 Tax=Pseudovibrio sp. Tun.PSC04-5.I4 TaxID=1798213 RepID=UPI0008885709|nr:DMT family transporter [Pseudovibrio sp. Tun.PSC04-5.I4]SDR35227.1 EamA-like transporter family protein [Pseudovibrio sp. Tun.PSC04-5.I4]